MSSRRAKSSGGYTTKQNSSEASTYRAAKPRSNASLPESEPYLKRLRPRPTKQTDHYQTTLSVGVVVTPRKRSTEVSPHTAPQSKVTRTEVTTEADFQISGPHRLTEKSSASKKLDSSKSTSPKSKIFHKKAKSTSNSSLPSTSKKSEENSRGKSKKLTEKKIGSFLSGRHKSNKKSLGNTSSNAKTGSCASSHRGSERSKAPTVARSSDTSQSLDVCSDTSGPALMRKSKISREAGNASKCEGDNDGAETSKSAEDSALEAGGATSSNAMATLSNNDSESEDSDVNRLQALLEARGLPPHFLGNLGPRMQQILHRSMGSGMNSKAQQYLQGLQAVGDESRQLQAAIGMCQLLVMGNEDTLAGFPIKSVVPALINLLKMEHNFDLMNHACRGLTYMMEALPRSSAVVVDAIPILLEKLQVIQCMDVAEQSLTALDMLSHRHAPAILAAGGQSACLLYIDFFSLPAQRSALSVAANCSSAIGTLSPDNPNPKEEFQRLVKSCLPLLSSRLTHHDKKCVESVCLCFVRLIDNYQYEPDILSEIAENDLLKNLQQLLVISPPVLSSNTFVMVIRSMTVLCRNVRSLVVELIRGNIAETLSYLLCGTPSEGRNGIVELLSRSSQELFEITTLITHLLPKLPMDDPLFAINSLTCKDNSDFSGNTQLNGVSWQWKDGTGQWQSYTKHAIRMLESAYAGGEHEVNLNTLDSSYTIDFEIMQQINDDTGTSRFVQRVPVRVAYSSSHGSLASQNSKKSDMEWNDIERDMSEFGRFVKTIFVIIYEVYCSSAGSPAVRQSCLHAMQKMVFFSKPELLIEVLRDLTLSSQISSMLSSFDIKLIVSALQLSEMIMQKLPDIFRDMFCKEGVVHQVKQLTDPSHPLVGTATDISKTSGAISNSKDGACGVNLATKKSPNSTSGKKSSTSSDDVSPPLTKAKAFAAAMSGKDNGASGGGGAKKKSSTRSSRSSRSSTSSFLSNFNPSKWGKSLSSALGHDSSESSASKSSGKTSFSSKMAQNSSSGSEAGSSNKSDADMKQVRQWIVNQAKKFLEYFKTRDDSNPQTNVLDQLTDIAKNLSDPAKDVLESLKQLCDISSLEVSPFELQHSGIVTSLLRFFTVPSSVNETSNCDYDELHIRIRKFLSVFAGLPEESMLPIGQTISHIDDTQTEPLLNMVRKLNQCVGQMEQFPVKSRDLMSGSSQILHVLSTKQLKCQLQRHPASRSIKQWLGGPVKVDPLVQVHAIERYLVTRGYGVKSSNISLGEPVKHMHLSQVDDQEDDSDDDMQNTVNDFDLDAHSEDFMSTPPESRLSSAASNSASSSMDDFGDIASGRARKPPDVMHKLAFYIGDHKVPHHITVYQALQQYGQASSNGLSGDERDRGFRALEKASFWNKTHVIMYRLASENDENSNSSHKEKTSIKKQRGSKQGRSTATKSKVNDPVWSNGIVMPPRNPLHQYLTKELPLEFSTSDPCKEVLCLLRIIHAIVRFWYYLYSPYVVHTDKSLVQPSDFVNFKVNAKCQHQLQDPLVVITGQLSTWVQEIGNVCPFLLAFEVRQLLFKVSALGRDRALQHLLETGAAQEFSTALNMSSHSSDNSNRLSRFMPRIEKKKCSVSRKNLLQQAEKIISDHGHSRAMIEVDYEEEVGTGLGPTLEFFTLTSKELQGCSLGLWRDELPAGEAPSDDDDVSDPSKDTSIKKYVATNVGLFPKPLGRAAKHNQVSRIKSKYRFIGKFLAKALLDGRLVDLPLSTTCYKWLLGKEHCFTSLDLMYVDTSLASSHGQFRVVAQEREHCFSDHEKLEQLSMDGCPIEDIGLDMRLPGYPNVELLKMGKNTSVTPHNFDKYLDLITHWTLHEGVKHQMDALREGFNSVLPISCLNYFYPEELDQLFCGCRYQPWDVNELSEACHPDHGYTQNSVTVKSLYKILSSYTASEQQNFLQFVTGCPHLPVGGLRVLNPRLTIVRKTCEDAKNIDDYLPSVMTCLNYLKLPEYSSEEVMRKKLKTAIKEGQKSFLLS